MQFQRINIAEAKTLLDNPATRIADIRDAMSFQAGRMRGALNVDNDTVGSFINESQKDAPLIVCCYHGNSSQQAAQFFAAQGFTEVYSLDGGYEMWKMAVPELCES
ncbi:thiosulfate sulfurtransferase GlpE [Thalassolituus sp.]|jgi:thiosulfate sulfurtransferase|uniref:thiosulfate sulfurtransferase GlpE n=1 Tax=Thalassolituus sp. TaxID=2030822 RepID=UPI002629D8D4|nr:thiosulfate sulfurtransferase GlpE [uncultured Thalassolituus sp.]